MIGKRGETARADYIGLNSGSFRADGKFMDLPPIAIAASLAVTVFAVFASLYVMAARFMYELALHNLKSEAQHLRTEYARRLEALRRAGTGEFDVEPPGAEELVGVDILPDDAAPASEAA